MNPTKAIRKANHADTRLLDIAEDEFIPIEIRQDFHAIHKTLEKATADLYEWKRDEVRRKEGKL